MREVLFAVRSEWPLCVALALLLVIAVAGCTVLVIEEEGIKNEGEGSYTVIEQDADGDVSPDVDAPIPMAPEVPPSEKEVRK